jgi:hypothetical protein
MSNLAFMGLRGTADWVADQRPKSWREALLYLYPNGDMPLTALTSKMASEALTDPEFYWWTKTLSSGKGAITGVFDGPGLTNVYDKSISAAAAGDTVIAQMSADDAKQFKVGHIAAFRTDTDSTGDVVGKVTLVTINGASSYITLKMLEADDNSVVALTGGIEDATELMIIGSAHEEGADRPTSVSFDPTKIYNLTQIFRNSLALTRTARQTKLRTYEQYKEAKREALEQHGIEMEKAFIWGIRTENTGAVKGKPERTTAGLISMLREHAPSNVLDFRTVHSGQTWLQQGENFLDNSLEQIFRYGSREKLVLCGSGALLGIQKIAKATGQVQLTPKTTAWGLAITEWITPFGTVKFVTHPLFSHNATDRNTMLLIEPQRIKYRYIQDTTFKDDDSDKKSTGTGRDGTEEEYLTECGIEYHFPQTGGILYGVGLNG